MREFVNKIILPKTLIALTVIVVVSTTIGLSVISGNATETIKPVQQAETGYNGAKVTFSFDDGYKSFLTKSAPVLNKYGFTGTGYITTNYIGSDDEFMTWDQVEELRKVYKWEIGGHSLNHPDMEKIDNKTIHSEVSGNYDSLAERGYKPETFATPFGSYTPNVVSEIATEFKGHRAFQDYGYNKWPYNNYLLKVQQVQVGVSVDKVRSYIDHAGKNNSWLILVFHNVSDHPKRGSGSYQYATKDLDSIAKYVKKRNIPVTTIENGLVDKSNNQLANGSFTRGISEGWTADNQTISANNKIHGAIPEPRNSIYIRSQPEQDVHLYAPRISVDYRKKYLIDSYVSIEGDKGEVGMYVDEYDVEGNWISGKYIKGVFFGDEKSASSIYKPSSSNVYSARLQFTAAKGTKTVAFIDEVNWAVIHPAKN